VTALRGADGAAAGSHAAVHAWLLLLPALLLLLLEALLPEAWYAKKRGRAGEVS
jgi:hypothetical protein